MKSHELEEKMSEAAMFAGGLSEALKQASAFILGGFAKPRTDMEEVKEELSEKYSPQLVSYIAQIALANAELVHYGDIMRDPKRVFGTTPEQLKELKKLTRTKVLRGFNISREDFETASELEDSLNNQLLEFFRIDAQLSAGMPGIPSIPLPNLLRPDPKKLMISGFKKLDVPLIREYFAHEVGIKAETERFADYLTRGIEVSLAAASSLEQGLVKLEQIARETEFTLPAETRMVGEAFLNQVTRGKELEAELIKEAIRSRRELAISRRDYAGLRKDIATKLAKINEDLARAYLVLYHPTVNLVMSFYQDKPLPRSPEEVVSTSIVADRVLLSKIIQKISPIQTQQPETPRVKESRYEIEAIVPRRTLYSGHLYDHMRRDGMPHKASKRLNGEEEMTQRITKEFVDSVLNNPAYQQERRRQLAEAMDRSRWYNQEMTPGKVIVFFKRSEELVRSDEPINLATVQSYINKKQYKK